MLMTAAAWLVGGCSAREPAGLPLLDVEQSLRPGAKQRAAAQPGDWLETHPEDGQTFAKYWKLKPPRLIAGERTIYLHLLGEFSPEQREVLEITKQYLAVFFQTPVVVRGEVELEVIPEHARRVHPSWGTQQINSAYVLNELLKPSRPEDALAYLCFTSSDLFSHHTRNYVLGEAQTWERLGVWSIYRYGDAAESEESFRQSLRRTMHVATHETGHILAMKHCTAFACNMNGANSVSETDRHPLYLCPVCLRKLLWNLEVEPRAYLADLEAFFRQHQFLDEAAWCSRAAERLPR
jgi:archaemetzincin